MLTTNAKERKATPIFSGVIAYFPNALAAVARVSKAGNDQHNPGEPLHWAREKSGDEYDACTRHLVDRAAGDEYDTDGQRHMAKVAWRALAALEKEIEAERAAGNEFAGPEFSDGPEFAGYETRTAPDVCGSPQVEIARSKARDAAVDRENRGILGLSPIDKYDDRYARANIPAEQVRPGRLPQ